MTEEFFRRIIRAAIESFPINVRKKKELKDRIEGRERKENDEDGK